MTRKKKRPAIDWPRPFEVTDQAYPEVEKRLLKWVIQRMQLGFRLTNAKIYAKAKEIKLRLQPRSYPGFGKGWLDRFKKRHNISLVCPVTRSNIKNIRMNIINRRVTSSHVQTETHDLPQVSSVIGEEQTSQEHVIDSLYASEQTESEENQVCVEEDIIPKVESLNEPEETKCQCVSDEVAQTELRHIFERLAFYSTRAPTHVKFVLKGLQIFFLDKEE